jgi:hypothetical protein
MQSYPLPLLISALTALVASILGPFVTLSVSRRQFRANVLSTNRQKWIDTFRDRLSELLAHINAAQATKRAATDQWRGGLGLVMADQNLADKLAETYRAIAQIQLLTKAEEPAHQALNESIDAALGYLQADELHEAELSAALIETTSLGRGIIRGEWGRVKRGV